MQSQLFTLEAKHCSGKCLTLRGKEDLVIADNKRQPSQLFELVKTDLGQVYLKCKQSGNAITLKQEAQNDGILFTAAPFQKKPTQKFRMQETSPHSNEYLIYTWCGKVLDVSGWSKKNNSIVHQWTFLGQQNQLWTLHKA